MRKLFGIAASAALAVTAFGAAPAAAVGSADDCRVNGGLSWDWSFNQGSGVNHLQVNARLDRDGEPTGVIHWRQTRDDDQNYINLRADVSTIYAAGEDEVYLIADIRNGVAGGGSSYDQIWVGLQDNGEPGTDDGAWVKYAFGSPLPFNANPKEGNVQVSCDVSPA